MSADIPNSVPSDCWTCRHRQESSTDAMSAFGCTSFHVCFEFRHDLMGAADPMECKEAFDTFCGGRHHKATLAARVRGWIYRFWFRK